MQFENLNEIIDFAIEKEKEAAAFYRDASSRESFSGAKKMLEEFAGEEDKHVKILEDLKLNKIGKSVENYDFKWITDMKRGDFVEDVKYEPGMGYRDMLMLAIKREEKALKLYNELLEKSVDESHKKVFKILCQEEAKHKKALETMYDDYMAEMGD
jgi:rubrerythrin